MKKCFMMVALIFFSLNINALPGLCWWPFEKGSEANLEQEINAYKDFEKHQNYSDDMLRKIQHVVKGDGKKNLTLRMALMRLKYYKAVQNEDQKTVQELSNEAESLLKGDHPIFRQDVRKSEVREFLTSLKDARYSDVHSYSWTAFFVTCIISVIITLALKPKIGEGVPVFILLFIGLIAGVFLYHFLIFHIFYTKAIAYPDIPVVPILS